VTGIKARPSQLGNNWKCSGLISNKKTKNKIKDGNCTDNSDEDILRRKVFELYDIIKSPDIGSCKERRRHAWRKQFDYVLNYEGHLLGRGNTKGTGNCNATAITKRRHRFKHTTGFQISRRILRKLMFD
jgi:hypothetical protein